MRRPLGTIYLPLSLLFVLVGCAGVEPPPKTSPSPATEVVPQANRAAPAEQVTTPPAGDNRTDSAEMAPSASPAASPTESVASAEPNAPDREETPSAPAATPDIINNEEPNEPSQTITTGAAEPNRPEPGRPQTGQFRETTPPVLEERPSAVRPAGPAEAGEAEPWTPASYIQGYAEILQEFVRDDGRIDYESLRRQRLRLKRLLTVPDELARRVYEKWSEPEKLAFWINTYNLKMLDVIVRNYPIDSSWWLRLTWPPSDIRHIDGIWGKYRFIVMDEEFTLGEVERRVFRKTFGDPRAFLAILYPARSGPDLSRQPYQGPTLDRQLDEQVRTFLSSDKGVRIDRGAGVVYLSALFKPSWRGKDFVGRYGTEKKFKDHPPETRAVLNFLTRYLSRDDVHYLEVENYTLVYMNFDWRLNDTGRGY